MEISAALWAHVDQWPYGSMSISGPMGPCSPMGPCGSVALWVHSISSPMGPCRSVALWAHVALWVHVARKGLHTSAAVQRIIVCV